MRIKKPVVKKMLRTLQDVRVMIDDANPFVGRKAHLLDKAYDSLLDVEDLLKKRRERGKRGY